MLWLNLTLVWFAANVVALFAPHEAANELKRYARYALILLAVRALKRVALRKGHRRAFSADRFRRFTCRRTVGSALRRALRTGSLHERAGAIYAAMTAPERWIARIAARLKRRFTKLRRLPAPRRAHARAITLALLAAASINSS